VSGVPFIPVAQREGLPWVSLEGPNGAGKTYLGQQAARRLGSACALLSELPDAEAGTLPASVIAALLAGGDLFLRGGLPLTETALLCALQVHRWESLAPPPGARVVLEDRGPWSVAVYQAVIAGRGESNPLALARWIMSVIGTWRPLPATTVLLLDDPGTCARRFEQRTGRPATASERGLMTAAASVYAELAACRPPGLIVIDRTAMSPAACADAIAAACEQAITRHEDGDPA
jgi:thymidylate kinase